MRYYLTDEARAWLAEHAPYDCDIVPFLSAAEVGHDINRNYPGGWFSFENDVRMGSLSTVAR